MSRSVFAAAALALSAACGSVADRRPAAAPEPVGAAPSPPSPAPTPAPAAPLPRVERLDNGMTVVVSRREGGANATLLLGLFAGTAFLAPGAAELAAQVLVDGSDPSEGRPPLSQTIRRLGGSLHVEPGPLTIWIDIRVPQSRWREAALALRQALATPTRSRSQIERIRDQFTAARTAEIRREPLPTLARLLLLGESSSSSHVLGLLDRDPAEIGLLQSRLHLPERMVLGVEVAEPADDVVAALGRHGALALGGWMPPRPLPGPLTLLERPFASGLYWARTREKEPPPGRCRVAILTALPDLAHPEAAAALLFHSCFSLEGVGGRLELLQREHGLAHIRWESRIVHTAETAAMLLTTEVDASEVPALWRTIELARASLRDVPPNASEFAVAARRAPLLAQLGATGDAPRLRAMAMLALRGGDAAAALARPLEASRLPEQGVQVAAAPYLALPFALIVVGGQPPAELATAQRFELLPAGGEVAAAASDVDHGGTTATASLWLARAIDAIGDAATVAALRGWKHEATIGREDAPSLRESLQWRDSGTIERTRELLGQRIVTRLQGNSWSEQLGDTVRSLHANEATILQREQRRHPLALLAAHRRGELPFRTIAQRDADDRTVVVLEAVTDRFDRLRMHVDTRSHLIRLVESWETLADGTVVHLADAWSDYRLVRGLRVPHRRVSTHDNGQNRVETVFAVWEPSFAR